MVEERLDHYLLRRFPQHSRARLQEWIRGGCVRVNGDEKKASYVVRESDRIEVAPAERAPLTAQPEAIPLEILYEDGDVVAINKPAGLVVHAGAGVRSGTLVNALLHRFQSLSGLGGEDRPGIVHRLDRYTSGVLLVAKNDAAHRSLAAQFAARQVEKTYLALVYKQVRQDQGRIEAPIARDPRRRVRMTARLGTGRSACSEYRVLRRWNRYTLLEVRIGTGRTHQIRAHLAGIGHPVAGDPLYGAPASPHGRFFLHAARIRFAQPSSGQPVEVCAALPPELEQWLGELGAIIKS
ncbi:MAG: RluA family pseudouridine synthase [Candidatus Solibacter usitatus]|nr:RluA family pseudouridine synthase [Candidatus Solibacter usitatus]